MGNIDIKTLMEAIKQYEQSIDEINCYRDEKGRITSKEKAKLYSCTKASAEHFKDGAKSKHIKRGRISGKGSVYAPYGANSGDPDKQVGRMTFSGAKKRKTRSLKDYPNTYTESEDGLDGHPEALHSSSEAVLAGDDRSGSSDERNASNRPKSPLLKIIVSKVKTEERGEKKKPSVVPGLEDMRRMVRGIFEAIEDDFSMDLEELIPVLQKMINENPNEKGEIDNQFRKLGYYSKSSVEEICSQRFQSFLKKQNSYELASKGELFKTKK